MRIIPLNLYADYFLHELFAEGTRMMLTSELAYEKPVTNIQYGHWQCEVSSRAPGADWRVPSEDFQVVTEALFVRT